MRYRINIGGAVIWILLLTIFFTFCFGMGYYKAQLNMPSVKLLLSAGCVIFLSLMVIGTNIAWQISHVCVCLLKDCFRSMCAMISKICQFVGDFIRHIYKKCKFFVTSDKKILQKKRCIGYCLITLGGVGFFDIGWGCISGFEAICVSVVCAMLVWLGIVYSKLSLTIIIDGYRLEQTISYLVTYHILPCVKKIEIWLQRIFNFGEGVDPQEVVRARLRIIVIFIPAALYCVAKIILYLIHHINSRFSIQDDWGYLIMLLIISFFVMCGIIVFCKKYISSVRHYAKIANAGAFKLTSKETFKNKILRFENKITAPMIMHENISLVLTALIIYILIPCFFISYTYCEFFKPNSDVLTALKICVTIVSFALAIYSMVYTALARKESNDNMRLQQFILRQNSQHERFKPTT